MEVGVTRVDTSDAVLAHEGGCVRIVQHVPAQVWYFLENLIDHRSVAIGFDEDTQCRRGQHRVHEAPRLASSPGGSQDTGVGHDSKKLIEHTPRRIPGGSLTTPLFEQRSATIGGRGVRVSRIDQHVRIHDEH